MNQYAQIAAPGGFDILARSPDPVGIEVNGNIIAWTAPNDDTLQRIDYDPFGNVVTRENVPGFDAPAWGFSTKYQDKETGLLHHGFPYGTSGVMEGSRIVEYVNDLYGYLYV